MHQDSSNSLPHVCIVEASAGTGKTYALAKRYIGLLINPRLATGEIQLKNILAITFSRKAALEMKARILDILKKIAIDCFASDEERKDILSFLGVPEKEASQKARALMEELLKNYNFFQVQTIDSFVNAILCGCAFKLGLSSEFRTHTDYSEYLYLSLDRLIDRAPQDRNIAGLFDKFLKQYLYMENRSGWFLKEEIFETMQVLFFKSNVAGAGFYRSRIEARDVVALKKKTLGLMRELSAVLPQETKVPFKNSFIRFLEDSEETFDMGQAPKAFEREEFPVTKSGEAGTGVVKLWKQIRTNLKKISEDESLSVFNPYIDIFKSIFEDFRILSHKDDVLFIEELNRRARELFDEEGLTVPELYYRLAIRLKHFLIDEFQDTSLLQWKNLDPMVEEALSKGGSLFYVGDKKQAIYRFRGGEAGLFDSVMNSYDAFGAAKTTLTRNYRSQRCLVEFFNGCFSSANLLRFLAEFSEPEKKEVLKVFENSRQDIPQGRDDGYVSVCETCGNTAEERNEAVYARTIGLLKDLHKRFNYCDIAILVRENDEAELLTQWLTSSGIPVESEKTLDIRNNAYIKELVSFLTFLNSPIDNLSFVSFILGDIFAKAAGKETGELRDFVFDISVKKERQENVYVYKEFQAKFPLLWQDKIEEFFRSVGFVPLYELVLSIIRNLSIFENFPESQGYFMKFLELIKLKEEEMQDLGSFLEYFAAASEDEPYVHVAGVDSVRVLTIHKAKGLGFPVVILPFFEMKVRVDSTLSALEDGKLTMRRINKKYHVFSKVLREAYRKEYLKGFIDELNTVYVGLTRAVDELYVFIPEKTGRGKNPVSALIPQEIRELGRPAANAKIKPEGSSVQVIPPSRYEDWVKTLREEFPERISGATRNRRQYGEALHYLLSFLPNLKEKALKEVLPEALLSAKNKFRSFSDWDELARKLRSFVKDDSIRPFFYLDSGCVFREREVVDSGGNTRRIDRLVVKDKEVWIIDYKSSRGSGSPAQVAEYISIVSDIYPGKKIKGFLLYLDEVEIEEVHG